MRLSFQYLVLLVFIVLSASAMAEVSERFEQTLPFSAGAHLSVTNQNGAIEVSSWDRNEVEVVAIKRAGHSFWSGADDEALKHIEIAVTRDGDHVSVQTRTPKGKRYQNVTVQYEVRVPAEAGLNLKTANGRVVVRDISGELTLNTVNGSIEAENVAGRVSSSTTNGSIDVELIKVSNDADMRFRTVNGSVNIALPADMSANLEAHTTNGRVRSDLPVSVQGKMRRNRLSGKLNGGGAELEFSTVNGSITITET